MVAEIRRIGLHVVTRSGHGLVLDPEFGEELGSTLARGLDADLPGPLCFTFAGGEQIAARLDEDVIKAVGTQGSAALIDDITFGDAVDGGERQVGQWF